MEKGEEIERERGEKTILKSEHGSNLPVQLGQLMDKTERSCCEPIVVPKRPVKVMG